MPRTVTVKQAANVLDLIEFFAAHRRPATLAEIARHFDWPRSSAFKLLGTLVERGYLYEPRAKGGYYPAPVLAEMVGRIEEAQPIPADLHALLEVLVEKTGETAVLAAASGAQALFLDAVESPNAIRYTARRGKTVPLHVTATGRALLSQMSADDRASVLRKARFDRYTEGTLMDAEAVEAEIALSTARGWFRGNAELTPGLGGVAVALKLPNRHLAVLVAGPMFRVQDQTAALAECLLAACRGYEARQA